MGSLGFDAPKHNVLVIGSGGVGTMAAYALEKGGRATVTAVLRSNFAVVQKRGFDIDSRDHGKISGWRPSHIRNTIPNTAEEAQLQPYDFVVVTTKNIADIPPSVATLIAPVVTPGRTVIALLQNGLNIEKPIVAAFPNNPVISGVPYIGASQSSLGNIKHVNHDKLIISPFSNPNIPASRCERAAEEFQRAYSCRGVTCIYEPNVDAARWKKLLYNSSYNTVATILRMDTSRMRVSEHIIDSLIRPAMQEIQAAAKAVAGLDISDETIEETIRIDTFEAFFRPSMLQDAEKGNLTEFENILGEPLRDAERHGVPTPTLRVIYSILKGLQWQTMESKGLITVPQVSSSTMKYGMRAANGVA
ncbi:putative 2-dehydropantoate 2-reductase [Podospora australis]|uniref:2-dehydropantoate 2-reductase n=1 Tax=Podospora australis TaxID=1536484 RepID=A0AAN6WTE1_9PEZI|nr:putative 2-dehydropantoate 2-reductase [Podospora australis]